MSYEEYVLIIAPHGNPFQWERAKYVLEEDGKRYEVETTTSLAVILKRYLDIEGAKVRVLVVVPETLLCLGGRSIDVYRKYGGKTLPEILRSRRERLEIYREAVENLRNTVEKYLEENVCRKLNMRGCIDDLIHILIAPNIGKYICENYIVEWSINDHIRETDIMSYYGGVLLLKSLDAFLSDIDLSADVKKPRVSIVVDITHGVNYMPLIAFRASSFLTRLTASLIGGDARIILYNSEPFIKGIKNPILRVHRVEEESFTSNRAVQRIVYTYATRCRNLRLSKIAKIPRKDDVDEEVVEFKKKLDSSCLGQYISGRRGYITGYASSIHYSLPLSMLYTYHYENLKKSESLEQLIDCFRRESESILDTLPYVRIYRDSDKVKVVYEIVLDYDYVKTVGSILGLKGFIKNIYTEYEGSDRVRISGESLYIDVELLGEILEEHLRGPHYLTSMNEIGVLKEIVRSIKEGKDLEEEGIHNPLTEIVKKAYETGEACGLGEKPDKRNFIAHGGLVKEIICFKRYNDKVYAGYRGDAEKTLLNILDNALKELIDFLESKPP